MNWISVKDKLPIQNEDVICYVPGDEQFSDPCYIIGYYYLVDDKALWWCNCRMDIGPFEPSYWMYLPDKPKEHYDA